MLKTAMFRIFGRFSVQFLNSTDNLRIGRKLPRLDAKFCKSTQHGQIRLKRGGLNVEKSAKLVRNNLRKLVLQANAMVVYFLKAFNFCSNSCFPFDPCAAGLMYGYSG